VFNALSIIIYSASFIITGLISGFGINTLIFTPLTLLLRTTLLVSTILFLESTRVLLIQKSLLSAHSAIAVFMTATISSILYTYILEGAPYSFNWLIKYFALLAYNTVLSIIAWHYGLKTQLLNVFCYVLLFQLSPILVIPSSLVIYILPISLQSIFISGLLYTLAKPTSSYKIFLASKPVSKLTSLVLIIFSISLLCSFILGVRFLAITSGSMSPSINIGDIVVSIPVSISNIQPGDIIIFKGPSSLIVHRVLENYNETCYVTKGDANENPDPLWACNDNIIGKVVITIPIIGLPAVYLLNYTGNVITSISLVLTLLSLIYVYHIVREVVVY